MPILDVEIVGELKHANLAQSLADAAGEILMTGPGRTWVKLRYLPKAQYAECGDPHSALSPVFVSVLQARGLEISEKSEFAMRLAKAFATIVDRPVDNIHVLFEPSAVGRIAFGGKLRTE